MKTALLQSTFNQISINNILQCDSKINRKFLQLKLTAVSFAIPSLTCTYRSVSQINSHHCTLTMLWGSILNSSIILSLDSHGQLCQTKYLLNHFYHL